MKHKNILKFIFINLFISNTNADKYSGRNIPNIKLINVNVPKVTESNGSKRIDYENGIYLITRDKPDDQFYSHNQQSENNSGGPNRPPNDINKIIDNALPIFSNTPIGYPNNVIAAFDPKNIGSFVYKESCPLSNSGAACVYALLREFFDEETGQIKTIGYTPNGIHQIIQHLKITLSSALFDKAINKLKELGVPFIDEVLKYPQFYEDLHPGFSDFSDRQTLVKNFSKKILSNPSYEDFLEVIKLSRINQENPIQGRRDAELIIAQYKNERSIKDQHAPVASAMQKVYRNAIKDLPYGYEFDPKAKSLNLQELQIRANKKYALMRDLGINKETISDETDRTLYKLIELPDTKSQLEKLEELKLNNSNFPCNDFFNDKGICKLIYFDKEFKVAYVANIFNQDHSAPQIANMLINSYEKSQKNIAENKAGFKEKTILKTLELCVDGIIDNKLDKDSIAGNFLKGGIALASWGLEEHHLRNIPLTKKLCNVVENLYTIGDCLIQITSTAFKTACKEVKEKQIGIFADIAHGIETGTLDGIIDTLKLAHPAVFVKGITSLAYGAYALASIGHDLEINPEDFNRRHPTFANTEKICAAVEKITVKGMAHHASSFVANCIVAPYILHGTYQLYSKAFRELQTINKKFNSIEQPLSLAADNGLSIMLFESPETALVHHAIREQKVIKNGIELRKTALQNYHNWAEQKEIIVPKDPHIIEKRFEKLKEIISLNGYTPEKTHELIVSLVRNNEKMKSATIVLPIIEQVTQKPITLKFDPYHYLLVEVDMKIPHGKVNRFLGGHADPGNYMKKMGDTYANAIKIIEVPGSQPMGYRNVIYQFMGKQSMEKSICPPTYTFDKFTDLILEGTKNLKYVRTEPNGKLHFDSFFSSGEVFHYIINPDDGLVSSVYPDIEKMIKNFNL